MLAAGPSYVSPALQLKREWSPWPELGGFFKMIICDGVSEFESLVSVSHVWVAELCARAAGSEIIAAPQSHTMFSTGSQ
jgi:hypothetical protein